MRRLSRLFGDPIGSSVSGFSHWFGTTSATRFTNDDRRENPRRNEISDKAERANRSSVRDNDDDKFKHRPDDVTITTSEKEISLGSNRDLDRNDRNKDRGRTEPFDASAQSVHRTDNAHSLRRAPSSRTDPATAEDDLAMGDSTIERSLKRKFDDRTRVRQYDERLPASDEHRQHAADRPAAAPEDSGYRPKYSAKRYDALRKPTNSDDSPRCQDFILRG
jgi:hypothetical protein